MAYKPIESYGVIGDLHTVALVGMDGSIDWCCLPQFDSPSIFAAILDEHKGGFFKIASLYEAQHKQMYLPDSNVLLTRFLSPEGVGEVVDFMPVQDPSHGKKTHQIVRVVRAVRGAVRFRLECQPAFDYARRPHQVTLEGRGAVFEAPGMRFSLVSRFPLAPKRPQLNNTDRCLLVWLYRWCPSVFGAIAIVRPETIIRWHRARFRAYWRWRSRNRVGRPSAIAHLPPQYNQLTSEHRVLRLKSALRLERRGEQGQEEAQQSDHRR